jgi:hypothetical protein
VITYGSPRVGDAKFVSEFEAAGITNFRIVSNLDIVPHGVPAWLGYAHVPREIWLVTNIFTGEINFKYCSLVDGEDAEFSKSMEQWGLYSITDHSNYLGIPNFRECQGWQDTM